MGCAPAESFPCPALLTPVEQDQVQESRAETLFVDQNTEKGELVL